MEIGPLADRVSLGRSDLRVRPLGVGTWAWGDRLVWRYGSGHSKVDVQGAWSASLDAGLDFFDTAEIYGRGTSESIVGEQMGRGGPPVVVATKFFPYPWRVRRKSFRKALKGSLKRLGVSTIDLYQIHFPKSHLPIESWVEELGDAAAEGLVRAVGVSNYSLDQMRRAHDLLAHRGVPLASNQVCYSLVNRDPEHNGVLAGCRELGITLIAYSPLGQGLLTGKYGPENPLPGMRRSGQAGRRLVDVQPLLALMAEIGEAHGGKTQAQVALNWLLCQGTLPIPGAKNARQALQNAGALGWKLEEGEVEALSEASRPLRS